MTSNDIAAMIKYYRKQSGLSQREFAKIAGIGKTALFDIEKGKESVQLNTLLKVLEVLNIKMTFNTPFPQPTEND
jgi:y4mF family transcriptional regulator